MAAPEAIPLLREFVKLQHGLCSALRDLHGAALDQVPRTGNLSVDEGYWEFQKHGSGVRFIRLPDHPVVDVHVYLFEQTRAIDAWRLTQYFESKEVVRVRNGGKNYDATDERSFKTLLDELERSGVLKHAEHTRGECMVFAA